MTDKDYLRKQLKPQLKAYTESVTAKSKSGKYVCPLCHSGEGAHGTGAFSITDDGESWHCFSCGESGDIFDLYGKINGTESYTEQLHGLAKEMGYSKYIQQESYTASPRTALEKEPERDAKPEPKEDYTEFFLKAHENIGLTDYASKRGLSPEIIERFNLGFVEEWRSPKASTAPASPRLIIPTSKHSYLARDTRSPEDIPESQKPYSKIKTGGIEPLNIEALEQAEKPVFIVEGELDAISIVQAGGEAVALGSAVMVNKFLERLERAKKKPVQPLILAMDNDKSGSGANDKLAKGLTEQGIAFYRFNPAGEYKDANEALQEDAEAFERAVTKGNNIIAESYIDQNSAGRHLSEFMDGINESVDTKAIPTGFRQLDEALDGGLYEGLYILGAISSLGKTTFVTQIADQIAAAGNDVLIISLEMARSEIMAKSISRETFNLCQQKRLDQSLPKTARGITAGKRWEHYSEAEQALIVEAMIKYEKYASRVFIREGIGDIGVKQIREATQEHIRCTGHKPVVVVDYLQIVAPYSDRLSDKQNMDKAVMELKRISRDYKIPIIGISSFNRSSYDNKVTMEAFKESGAIEYSSDVLIGLQLAGAGEKDFNATEAKRENPRQIELVMLKNRNGAMAENIELEYYPMFNEFVERF